MYVKSNISSKAVFISKQRQAYMYLWKIFQMKYHVTEITPVKMEELVMEQC